MTPYQRIEKVIRYLRVHHPSQPNLSTLAGVAGVSPFHFHRLFSRWAGVTPKAFLKFLTLKHAQELLSRSNSVLDTSLECGLSGPGRLHDLFVSVEGVTPGQFKTGGKGILIRYGFHPSPFGPCLVGSAERGICHLAFLNVDRETAVAELRSAWPGATVSRHQESTGSVLAPIFTRGGKPDQPTPVLLKGTPFQLKVWEALLRIPCGGVVSYQEVARWIGRPSASRAVASAVARNPVAYLIPCHRVIRATGAISGYRWGAERKRAILAWESAR